MPFGDAPKGNLNMGQIETVLNNVCNCNPVMINAGSLQSLIDQIKVATGSQPTVPNYDYCGRVCQPVDLTGFAGV